MSVLPDPTPGGEPGGPLLPAWAKTLQRRVRQRGIDFFILHGPGVRDLHPLGLRRFGTIGDFLAEVIFGDRLAIVTYDRGAGIGFTGRDVENVPALPAQREPPLRGGSDH